MARVTDPGVDDALFNCLGVEIPERYGFTYRMRPEEDEGFESLTVSELKVLLRQLGLPVSGKKADLIARLNEENEYRNHLREEMGLNDDPPLLEGRLLVIERENDGFQWRGTADGGPWTFTFTEGALKDTIAIDLESQDEVNFLLRWYPHGYECHGKSSIELDPEPIELERAFSLPAYEDDLRLWSLVSEPRRWAREATRRMVCVSSALCGDLWGGASVLSSFTGLTEEEDSRVHNGEILWDYWSSNQDSFDPRKRHFKAIEWHFVYPFWEISEKRAGAYADLCEIIDLEKSGGEISKMLTDSLVSLGSYFLIPIHLMEYRFIALCKSLEILFTLLYSLENEFRELRIPPKVRFSREWKEGYQFLNKKIEYIGAKYGLPLDSGTTEDVRRLRNEFAHYGVIWDEERSGDIGEWLLSFTDKALRQAIEEEFSRQGLVPDERLFVFRSDIPDEFRFTTN